MKALRLHSWGGRPVLEEVLEPSAGPDEVLVEVEACGVGLTVLNYMGGTLGSSPDDLPRIPGHELVGVIRSVGAGVPEARVGERVTAFFYLHCGRCVSCLAGLEDRCLHHAGHVGVHRDGGYAERVALPARNAIALPAGLDPVLATVIADAVGTPVHVCRRAGIGPGQRVAVVGAGGGLGIHMAQAARAWGAQVVGIEVVESKRDFLLEELGIAVELPATWGGKADVVVDFVGTEETQRWALGALGIGGRLVVLTTHRPIGSLPVSPREMVFRELSVLGSRYCTRSELALAARLVAEGRVRPVVSRRERLEGVESIHDDLRTGRLLGRGALVL